MNYEYIISGVILFLIFYGTSYVIRHIPPFCDLFPEGLGKYYKVNPKSETTFDDVIGCDSLKESLKEDINEFESGNYDRFKGYILYGEPGTGKTMMMKAISNKMNLPFIQIYPDNLYTNDSIRNLFDHIIKNYAPCYLLLDEGSQTLSASSKYLLSNIDGLQNINKLFVIITSNEGEYKKALLRSGRFNNRYKFSIPDDDQRMKFFEKKFPEKTKEEIDDFVNSSTGFNFADLELMIENFKNQKSKSPQKSLTDTIDNIRFGQNSQKFFYPKKIERELFIMKRDILLFLIFLE